MLVYARELRLRKLQISNATLSFEELVISLGFCDAKRTGFSNPVDRTSRICNSMQARARKPGQLQCLSLYFMAWECTRYLRQVLQQVIWASGYEPEGREFDSLRARHSFNQLPTYPPCLSFHCSGWVPNLR